MEVLLGVSIGLAIVSLGLSVSAIVFAFKSVSEVRGLQNSTHSVQFVPAESMAQKEIDKVMEKASADFFDFTTMHKPTAKLNHEENMI